jgi:hypothetical protein
MATELRWSSVTLSTLYRLTKTVKPPYEKPDGNDCPDRNTGNPQEAFSGKRFCV